MNTIDTRDLYKRKFELEELRDAVTSAKEELEAAKTALEEHNAAREDDEQDQESWEEQYNELTESEESAQRDAETEEADFGTDEQEELVELENLESEITDFKHGETMIHERDFEEYARQLAESIGAIDDETRWPCTCIDWEQAARELKQDYTTVTYRGADYLVRA